MTTLTELSAEVPVAAIRPEIELLLCCARTRIDPETAERIRTLLLKNIDWRYLVQTSLCHGVMPLLYQNLNDTCSESVPQPILVELRNHFQKNAAYNLFLTQELLKLLNLFEEHDIPTIPFKGPVLTAIAYGNLSLRQFGDLDILVHKQDFLRAKDLLIRQGYHHLYFGEHETANAQAQLLRDDGLVNVDLHYGMTPRDFFFSLESEPFWHRHSSISLADTKVNCFSPEDSLLVAYVHGYKDGWSSLKRICDMAELICAHPRSDWGKIMNCVDTLGVERSFLIILLFANNYLGTPLPEIVSKRIKALPTLRLLTLQLHRQLFCETEQTLRFGETTLFRLATMDNLQNKLQYFFRIAFTLNEKDRESMPLPTFLSLLYYPLRLFRLVITYKPNLGRLFKSLLG